MAVIQQGAVNWSGENPGIYLKDPARPDGGWTALALYFRVVASAHGRGRGMLVLGAPQERAVFPEVPNVCLTDNVPLMRYLLAEFVPAFGAFRNLPALGAIEPLQATGGATDASQPGAWSETIEAPRVRLGMHWGGLGAPFAADVGPDLSATGRHRMYSVFQGGGEASITIDDRPLAGVPVERDFLGGKLSSAFLAFAESWIEEPAGATR